MELEVNQEELLDRIGHDKELLEEVLELFYSEYPSHIEKIRSAQQAQDADALAKAAHTLKGSISNFACPAAFDAARELELTGKNNNLDQTESAIQNTNEIVSQLRTILEQIIREMDS